MGRNIIDRQTFRKVCKTCLTEKPYNDFYYGCSICKVCRKEYDHKSYMRKAELISKRRYERIALEKSKNFELSKMLKLTSIEIKDKKTGESNIHINNEDSLNIPKMLNQAIFG